MEIKVQKIEKQLILLMLKFPLQLKAAHLLVLLLSGAHLPPQDEDICCRLTLQQPQNCPKSRRSWETR